MKTYPKEVINNWRKFTKPNSIQKRTINQVVLKYPDNSKRHEMGKINIAFKILEAGHCFVMEAQEIGSGSRVRDVVDLNDMIVYEIETDSHRANRHTESYVQVLRVNFRGRILHCREKECKSYARYIKYDIGYCKGHYKPTSKTEQNQKWNGGL